MFEAQVARTPAKIAVEFEAAQLTYAELNARANQLAHQLRALGVGPDVLVGVLMERSLEMAVALLAILKAGGAYLPLDVEYPPERVRFMLEDSCAPVVLTQTRWRHVLPDSHAQVLCLDDCRELVVQGQSENPVGAATADNLAYVIYTSGSTGRPKGVMIQHRSPINLLKGLNDAVYARHADRIFGYCLGLLRNREEAEDAVQTTFLNAYRGLRRGIRPEFEAAWLFKIAQNVCRTRQSNAWRRGRLETVRDLDSLQDAVAAPEHDAGQAAALAEALEQLPERYRTVILLREWQGLSYREIAAATGDSEAAVEMLVFRARRALAERLERSEVRSGALSLSSLASLLKSLFGGVGAKALATALAVTATAIAVATVSGDQDVSTRQRAPAAPSGRLPSASSTRAVSATHSGVRRGGSPAAAAVPPGGGGAGSSGAPSTRRPSRREMPHLRPPAPPERTSRLRAPASRP